MPRPKGLTLSTVAMYAVLIGLLLAIVIPMFITVSQTFQTNNQLYSYPPVIVSPEPTVQNWENLFTREDLQLIQWLANSVIAAVGHTLLVLAITSPAAYAFARIKFPGQNILFFLLLATLMIPGDTRLIPNYLVLRDLKLLGSIAALILPGAANVFGVFLLRQFFMSIPAELEEAAIIDGASRFGVFWRIILPLSTPALTALAIFVFQANWNDFLWPLVVTSQVEQRTLPVGLSILQGAYGNQQRGLVLAAAIFSTIPVMIMYLIFQRQIIKGVTFTSGFGGR
jgi:multiple sugar transport system permease protein